MSERDEFSLPEITSDQLADWIQARPGFFMLDVREPYELTRARLTDERVLYTPLSNLARKNQEGLPEKVKANRAAPLVVFCHHGMRSAQVTAWLLSLGWQEVYNLAGGIDAYARLVDPRVGIY